MIKMKSRPPIIIIGMHRSGTTMITQMLEHMGLFVGNKLDSNHESIFFQKLNDWMLCQCHGGWTHPEHIEYLLTHKDARDLTVDYLRCNLKGLPVVQYTGIYRYLKGVHPFQMAESWGWKDPRNTFTLPIWLDLFPEAKVLHIYRNGVDVANSLHVRGIEYGVKPACITHENRKRWLSYWTHTKVMKLGFRGSLRCLSLKQAFMLWEEHVAKAFEHMESINNEKLNIKYEEFLQETEKHLFTIASFCELNVKPSTVRSTTNIVQSDRGNAYKNNIELMRFFEEVKESYWLKRLGYSTETN